MKLYEIVQGIDSCIDEETGEINLELMQDLRLEFDTKLENLALYYKNLNAEKDALAAEIATLTARKKSKESKMKSILSYVDMAMNATNKDKLETARVVISRTKSSAVKIEEGFEDDIIAWANKNNASEIYKTEYTLSKTEIKKLLATKTIPHCSIEERLTRKIK